MVCGTWEWWQLNYKYETLLLIPQSWIPPPFSHIHFLQHCSTQASDSDRSCMLCSREGMTPCGRRSIGIAMYRLKWCGHGIPIIKHSNKLYRDSWSVCLGLATRRGWWCRSPQSQPKCLNGCLCRSWMCKLWCTKYKQSMSSRCILQRPELQVRGSQKVNGGSGVSQPRKCHRHLSPS